MKFKTCALAGLLMLLAAHSLPAAGSTNGGPAVQSLQFDSADFAGGTGDGFVITAEGLTLAEDAMTAVYTSPVIAAPISFNAAVPQWIADVPDMTSIELRARTKTAVGDWSQWVDIRESDDLTVPDDPGPVGEMITVPAVDVTHEQIQFSVSFGRYAGVAAPLLRRVTFALIDASAGPTTEEMLAQQAALDAAKPDSAQAADGAYPRPTVISRDVWCLSVDCDYSTGLHYEPATHMVIHHTVSSNSSSDWAAIVRAIWAFHTYPPSPSCPNCRGWGDIGYNYLVDRTGVLYEGHLNEDYLNLDVIGTHAADANAGSMGVALIGTFTTPDEYPVSDTPPAVMQSAAADLLAWKADQRNIDVYDASRLVNMTWGLPHLMGHRDVYGGTATTCPGGNGYALLSDLRDQVAQRINFISPHIYVDELSGAFTKSANNWYEGPRGCGNNGHSYYTWNVTSQALVENWGEWRPDVPQNGRYEIEVYAPYCDTNSPETAGAIYTITHANGTDTVTVSHQANAGLWMSLGEFDLTAGTGNLIRLTDLTSGDPTNYDYAVWFDGIRLRPLEASATLTAPASAAWLNQTTVDFAWNVANPDSVLTTTLQVATDAAFSNMVYTQSWGTAVNAATHTFSQEYANLYWRVRLNTNLGNQIDSTATHFGIDITSPASQVTAIYKFLTGDYILNWTGNDAGSGVAAYTIAYRAQGDTVWTNLVGGTTAVSATFTPPNPAQTYEFRSQATDQAGNVEATHAVPDTDTSQAILLSHAIMLPIVRR